MTTPRKKPKRANGEGTYYQRSNGAWVGEVLISGTRRRVSGKTKGEATIKLRELLRQCETGDIAEHVTVEQLVAEWQRVKLPTIKCVPSTRTRFRVNCAHIVEHLGPIQLDRLTSERVELMFDELAARPLRPMSEATLTGLRSCLSKVLAFGVGRRRVERNVAETSVVPPVGSSSRPRQSLSVEQARSLYDACAEHRLGALWRVQLMTGVRPGEAMGLIWSSVDLDGAVPSLTLSRTVRLDEHGKPFLGDGVKTDGSYRSVAIPPPLLPLLRELRAAFRAAQLASRSRDEDVLLFSVAGGGVLSPSNVRRDFAKLLKSLDLPPIMPNELRHTAASLMFDAGMSLDDIAAVVGHKTTRMLEQRYRHRLRPIRDEHVAVMSTMFAEQS